MNNLISAPFTAYSIPPIILVSSVSLPNDNKKNSTPRPQKLTIQIKYLKYFKTAFQRNVTADGILMLFKSSIKNTRENTLFGWEKHSKKNRQ